MSLFENKSCPVCNRDFIDGDDIVVCPECGTPHHRECYNLIGHCVNKGLHKANYDYNREASLLENTQSKTATEASNEYHSQNSEDKQASSQIPNPFAIPEIDAQFENDREKIDGEDISDIAATVRINAPYYVTKFKQLESQNKKTSWNWSGFFFGSFYLLHRKMYRVGIGFFSLVLALFYTASALIYKLAPTFMNAIAGIAEMTAQRITPTNEQIEAVMASPDAKNATLIVYGMFGIILIFHIIIALFANGIYKKQVINIVRSVKEQLDNGASFSQSSMLMTGDLNMSQEQMKRMYLSRKGGTSFIAPAIALMLLSLII